MSSSDDLEALSQLHLGAAIALVQAALPAMKQNRFGRIVLMSSRGALGLATRTAYAATKAGMVGMARTWALELAGDGITVNVVAPGPISDTEMFREHRPGGQRAREGARRGDPGEAAGPQRRRGARGDVLLRPRQWLRHRPDAVRLRRRKPGNDRHLTHCQRPREVSRKIMVVMADVAVQAIRLPSSPGRVRLRAPLSGRPTRRVCPPRRRGPLTAHRNARSPASGARSARPGKR